MKVKITRVAACILFLGVAGNAIAQPAPTVLPEPTFTPGYQNPIRWEAPTSPGVTITAWEIWVAEAETGFPTWNDAAYADTFGPPDTSVSPITNIMAEVFGDTYGCGYAYPVGRSGVGFGPADDPLASGARYCFKVRYRWRHLLTYGFSDWSETVCSRQDASPPEVLVETLPIWINTAVCTVDYKALDHICSGVDSSFLWYKTNPLADWVRYGANLPLLGVADTFEGSFIFDSDATEDDNPYYFFIAARDTLGNVIVPDSVFHSPMMWTRIDDTDPESEIESASLPLYYNGSPGGVDLHYAASDTYSGVFAVFLDTDYGSPGHSYSVDTSYFYGASTVDDLFNFGHTANGEWNLRTAALDSAGNRETETAWDWTIYVDTREPEFASVNAFDTTTVPHRFDVPALTGWTNDPLIEVVPVSPVDTEIDSYASGIDSVIVASNSTFTSDYVSYEFGVTPYLWNVTTGADGDRDIFVKLEDFARNVSDYRQGIITLDTQAPAIESIELRNQLSPGTPTDTTISLTVDIIATIDTFGGTVSGIYFTQDSLDLFSIDDADWEEVDGDYEFTFTGFSDLDWMTLYAVVRDSAGNVSATAADDIRYVTGNKFVEILYMRDFDGPDMSGRYTDTTLVDIRVRYGTGIDSILIWDGSSAIGPPDTAFWVPDPVGDFDTVTVTGKLDYTDGWHYINVRGKAEFDPEPTDPPELDSIELDKQKPTIGLFDVVDITTTVEPSIPADVADPGWTNSVEVKAYFNGVTDVGGAPPPGTGIYRYRISTNGGTDTLSEGAFPPTAQVLFDLPVGDIAYTVWGEVQDSAGNWSSEVAPDAFDITLDTHIPTLDSIQLWDTELTSQEYTDEPEITVRAFGEDTPYNLKYVAIFEDLGDYPAEVRLLRIDYDELGMPYTLQDTMTGGLKTVYVALMDCAGNISGTASASIIYNKEITLDLTLFDLDSDPMNTECTNERTVGAILGHSETPPYQYILTETMGPDPLPGDTRWDTYNDTVSFQLSTGEGEKVVYGWLLSESFIVSPVDADTIYLDQTAPELTDGFFVWDTSSVDIFPDYFTAAMGWSNEEYIYGHIPGEYDDGCGTDSMKFGGGVDLDLWQPIPYNIDTVEHTIDLPFSSDSIPLVMDTDTEGRKDITAHLSDFAGNWGNPFDPNSEITIHGGYDTQPPDFEFLDVFAETVTVEVTTTRPSSLPLHVTDEPAPGFLWKVCWQIDGGEPECTIYDETWDSDSALIFYAAFPETMAELLVPDTHYDLGVVVIDSAGNPSALKTADLLVIPDTIGFGFTVVDSNDTDDDEYCSERTVMTKIDIPDDPDEMRFGLSPTSLGTWTAFSENSYFSIGSGADGVKWVFAQVRFGTQESKIESTSIILDTHAPSVGNIVAFDITSGDEYYSDERLVGFKAIDATDETPGVIGALLIAEDSDFTVNLQKCDFDSVDGTVGYCTYEASEEPYIPEGTEPSGAIRQDARVFWAKLLDRAENPAPQIKQPAIVIDLDDKTITNFPNPFNPDIEPTLIRVKGLDAGATVEVSVYDNYGNLVVKKSKTAESGSKAVDILWDGKNGQGDVIAGGVYVAVVDIGGEIFKRKIAVWKGGE
ncbi:hypothetical protein DRQ36_01475 [bacterium]|nr:MAG: hypothetical protein DRQ36_01475 [bacterium]